MNQNRKKLLGAVCLAIAGFLFWMLNVSAYHHLSAIRDGIEDRQAALDERQAAIRNRNDLQQAYDRQRSEIQKFTALIPATKSVPELVSALDEIGRTSGLTINEVGFNDKSDPKDPLNTTTLNIKAGGSYDA